MQTAHDLAHEFPEMKDAIHTLKTKDAHFRRLFDEYDQLVHELKRVADGAGAIDDEQAEHMKVKRLALKDDLFTMLKQAQGTCCGSCSH